MITVYVASSWRNELQPEVVRRLMEEPRLVVYDFRHPCAGGGGFHHWSEIDGGWKSWGPARFRAALDHPIAERGFCNDFGAMQEADAFVLVQPCGRSAHLELGWAAGRGLPTFVLLAEGQEPELMYKLCTRLCLSIDEVIEALLATTSAGAKAP